MLRQQETIDRGDYHDEDELDYTINDTKGYLDKQASYIEDSVPLPAGDYNSNKKSALNRDSPSSVIHINENSLIEPYRSEVIEDPYGSDEYAKDDYGEKDTYITSPPVKSPPQKDVYITSPPHKDNYITSPPHKDNYITSPPHKDTYITSPPHKDNFITSPKESYVTSPRKDSADDYLDTEPYEDVHEPTDIYIESPPPRKPSPLIEEPTPVESPAAPEEADSEQAVEKKSVSFEEEEKVVRREVTAKQRWHWAYNKIIIQLNVSCFIFYSLSIIFITYKYMYMYKYIYTITILYAIII